MDYLSYLYFVYPGFKIAAGYQRQPALCPPLPAIYHPRNRKKWPPIPWSVKSTSLERHSKRFISESNAAMKHLHTYNLQQITERKQLCRFL